MITPLLRLLPMALMVVGAMKVIKKSDRWKNGAQQILVQSEIANVLQHMHLDSITDPNQVPTAETFPQYLRQNMETESKTAQRDVTLDLWQSPYAFRREGNRVFVSSAGPDRRFGSPDDIVSSVELAN